MDEEKQLETVMEIIANAGEAKSMAMAAMARARRGELPQAEEMLARAEKSANQAHCLHSDLLAYDANNGDLHINLLTVHAADHLTSADVMTEMGHEIVGLYKTVNELKQEAN